MFNVHTYFLGSAMFYIFKNSLASLEIGYTISITSVYKEPHTVFHIFITENAYSSFAKLVAFSA
jgi:hypothetical protein